MSEIVSLACAQGECVMNGIFVRGGSGFGLWYKRKDTLISPAMVNAYQEEQRTNVPMISIHDDLYEHLANHPDREIFSKDHDPFPEIFIRCTDVSEHKQFWFIDYLPLYLMAADGVIAHDDRKTYEVADTEKRQVMRDEAFTRDVRDMCKRHKEAILNGISCSTTEKIRSKYNWLSRYHNEAVQRVPVEVTEDLLIPEGSLT